jgi:hypothetical protein
LYYCLHAACPGQKKFLQPQEYYSFSFGIHQILRNHYYYSDFEGIREEDSFLPDEDYTHDEKKLLFCRGYGCSLFHCRQRWQNRIVRLSAEIKFQKPESVKIVSAVSNLIREQRDLTGRKVVSDSDGIYAAVNTTTSADLNPMQVRYNANISGVSYSLHQSIPCPNFICYSK